MVGELSWSVLNHLEKLLPGLGGVKFGSIPRRFKRTVHMLDSTTIKRIANRMDWATRRRRKAIEWQIWTALLMYVLLRVLHSCPVLN